MVIPISTVGSAITIAAAMRGFHTGNPVSPPEKGRIEHLLLRLARTVSIAGGEIENAELKIIWNFPTNNFSRLKDRLKWIIAEMTSESEQEKLKSMAYSLGLSPGDIREIERLDSAIEFPELLMEAVLSVHKSMIDDKSIKKKIFDKLTDHGVDLSDIPKETIQFSLFFLEETRKAILVKLFQSALLRGDADLLSKTQKKTLIFDLLGTAYADGEICDMERFVIKGIAENLSISPAFLQEAETAVKNLQRATQDALELMSE